MKPNLIYCAGGNRRFAEIAIANGLFYGARLPRDRPHFPIFFADQDWRKPRRSEYMRYLASLRPTMATVKDLTHHCQLRQVLNWAEEASQYCAFVVIIPKVSSAIKNIPQRINQKPVVLGYSVPTTYGSTIIHPRAFAGRTVHLLGGSPHRQMDLWRTMRQYSEVFSLDGNYTQLVAIRYNKFWTNGDASYAENRWLPRLDEADGIRWPIDAPYEAFRRSCQNIVHTWNLLASTAAVGGGTDG
jgi:Family of unknown function (DUF6610)